MRLRQLYEDGRIVKGVNTTPDVDVNSISKEAAKFGFKVDKDGRPQNHPKKVKGSKIVKLEQKQVDELANAVLDMTDDIALECVSQLENNLKG
mgnify:CR=1 FL=1